LDKTDINKEPLEDKYHLYANYPNNWLMHNNNNGDISNISNILDFQIQFKKIYGDIHSVDLYTCDLGSDVSNDYNNQEKIHLILNLSQIVCGLSVLKSGGNMVVKHFTIFEPFTISYISLLTELFEQVIISKPLTSKRTNSEIYIVCKNYKFPFIPNTNKYNIYKLFIDRVSNKNTSPMIPSKYIKRQINDINLAMKKIYTIQIEALEHFKYTYINNVDNSNDIYTKCLIKLRRDNNYIKYNFKKIPIYPIDDKYNLNVISIYDKYL
jgi:23S rRNA U2552 (ribose-2'-O)-methylase RlmE/FtsJ